MLWKKKRKDKGTGLLGGQRVEDPAGFKEWSDRPR